MSKLSSIGLALVPTVSVPFSGASDSVFAWGRLLLYGGIALAFWDKKPRIAKVSAAAAGLSLLTSLGVMAWDKSKIPVTPQNAPEQIPEKDGSNA
jgi:hypothetical protein